MAKALVIGGGPNGMASAVALAAKGHDVALLEARESVGGRTALLGDTRLVQPWAVQSLGLDVEWAESPQWVRAGEDGVCAAPS